jgi:hypothetical protein
VATDEALSGAASLYAHLTGRSAALSRPFQPLPSECDIVLLRADDWTGPTADWLEAEAAIRPGGLGIILAPTAVAMAELCACYAVALAGGAGPTPRPVTMLSADKPVASVESPAVLLVGAHATPAAVRSAFGRSNGLLVVHAHGDGFDAKLGETAILCAYAGRAPVPDGRSAACLIRDRCHRLDDLSLPQARATGRLVASSDIRARIVALELCSGMPVSNRAVGASSSLGAAILEQACFGAVIATAEIFTSNAQARLELVSGLRTAARIGEALFRINAGSAARSAGRTLFLFGDPRYGDPGGGGRGEGRESGDEPA